VSRELVPTASAGPSRAQEVKSIGILAVQAFRGTVSTIQGVHRGVADRAFSITGAMSLPTQLMHDAISAGAYAAVRGVGAVTGAAGTAAAVVSSAGRPALSASARGVAAIAALNGAFGDRIERDARSLDVGMSIPHPLPEPATPRLVLFLHGLCESELSWRLGRRPPYGELLARDHGFSPLYLRYNTGLPIEENGRRLARLLDELVAGWPVEVEELSLVGHSMGGLVIRAACNEGGEFCSSVGRVIYLGSPHLGAPLEQGAAATAELLARLPETAPLAQALDIRSAGIKDLRRGNADLALLECAGHYCIGATITREEGHPLGRIVGDLLVLGPSASGIEAERLHIGSLNHFTLLNHPRVYERLEGWLREPCPR
jgi:pimeloyl-ACP methyl ester carboxylesterase